MKTRQLSIPGVDEVRDLNPEGRVDDLTAVAGQFACIYADPPWAYDMEHLRGGLWCKYDTMSPEAICALPGAATLGKEDGAHLWMWTTWPMLREGTPHRVLEAWGFRWVGEILWLKPGMGVGRWLRPSTEILILGVKGKLPLLRKNQKGHLECARRGHSVKPPEFYEVIESLSPGPRIELFARRPRRGWMRWGNEA